jgi:hypothetical protein
VVQVFNEPIAENLTNTELDIEWLEGRLLNQTRDEIEIYSPSLAYAFIFLHT